MTPRIPWPGGKRVAHLKQLRIQHRYSGTNCGPCADLMAMQGASGADIRLPREDQADWITALRNQMTHGPKWPATRLTDQRAAFTSALMTGAFLPFGKRRPVSGTLTVSHDRVVQMLAEDRCIVVAIDYGRLTDLMPALSGSATFRGGHAIALQGLVRQNGVAWTRLGDPLHDGRISGGRTVPKGWQTVRVRRYLRAAEPYAGKGQAIVLWLSPAEDL